MFKKALIVGLVLALAVAIYPASAAKKKSKKPKPYKSEQVTLLVPHPVAHGATGSVNSVTAKEFESKCATPSTNGLDAYVFEVPKEYQSIVATVEATGSAGPGGYDLDVYIYDANCKNTGAANSDAVDELGAIPVGTAWILVHNYLGEPGAKAQIELKAQ